MLSVTGNRSGIPRDINGAGLASANGIVYGFYSPSFTKSTVEAINPQNGHTYWSKNLAFAGSNAPQILVLGTSLIVPSTQFVLDPAMGAVLWQFPHAVLVAAIGLYVH